MEILDTGGEVWQVRGALDIPDAEASRDALIKCLNGPSGRTLDLSGVERCDATGLQLLIAAAKTAAHQGKPFRITSLSDAIVKAGAALGVDLQDLGAGRDRGAL